jgi:hypothetical protein
MYPEIKKIPMKYDYCNNCFNLNSQIAHAGS